MRCPGLHCPGCGDAGGSILAIAAVLVAAEVIAQAIWLLIAVTAAAGALSLAVVVLLSRATARREAAFGGYLAAVRERQALTVTAVTVTPAVPAAIENRARYRCRAADGQEAARVIRTAIPANRRE